MLLHLVHTFVEPVGSLLKTIDHLQWQFPLR